MKHKGNGELAKPPSVLDLFAGAGGFSLGFEMAGCFIKGAIERDSWACETFAANHPDAVVLKGDLEAISDEDIKRTFGQDGIDIVVGGPPCQGFSVCRRGAQDPNDPRNTLFMEFVRVCKLLKPRLVVMENVPNLLKATITDGTSVIDVIFMFSTRSWRPLISGFRRYANVFS
jgi:DNA (cytosine-5)-methyltransferase 1